MSLIGCDADAMGEALILLAYDAFELHWTKPSHHSSTDAKNLQ